MGARFAALPQSTGIVRNRTLNVKRATNLISISFSEFAEIVTGCVPRRSWFPYRILAASDAS
jgi:hypothetical protein